VTQRECCYSRWHQSRGERPENDRTAGLEPAVRSKRSRPKRAKGHTTRTSLASSPLRPGPTSNSTVWPWLRGLYPAPEMLEKWTNTSSLSSREMKPKPFSALKNFTVPVGTALSSLIRAGPRDQLARPIYRSSFSLLVAIGDASAVE